MTAPTHTGAGDWETTRAEATLLLGAGDYAGVVIRLESSDNADPSGETQALRGLAHFHLEQYEQAARHLGAALRANPQQQDWASLLAQCQSNIIAEVNVAVPDVYYFDRDDLLGAPPDPSLPSPPRHWPRLALWRRVRYLAGHAIGTAGGAAMGGLTNLIGRKYSDEVWTNWYRKRLYTGILTLAYMREMLNRNNLKSSYPDGAKIGFLGESLTPPPGVSHYRTADGSWNNLADPKEGSARTRFPRNVENSAIRVPTNEELLSPNPRLISRELLTRGDTMKEVPFLNLLAASWIQFQNHDWVTHAENLSRDLIEIPLADDDPARRKYHQSKMFVGRTQPDASRQDSGETTPLTYINEVTHWWDGSQIYGSDQATQDRLRSGVLGKLSVTDDETLPLNAHGVEDSGMIRNWWVGLAMLHTLFVREHNAICDHLHQHYPDWDDDRLFNVARLVNAAVMAKIHSIEWTPAILPNSRLSMGLNANWYGLLTYRFKKSKDRKTVADFNVANPELGGIVGNHRDAHGAPYGLTEEFVEVYRLHSLLPETLHLRRRNAAPDDIGVDLAFASARQAGSPKLTAQLGMSDLFYSFGNQMPGALELNNFPRFMQELSIPGNPVFDMGAIDILRARERGVPRYNDFRRQLGLNPIRTFDDLTDDPETLAKLTKIYGDVEALDLLIGTLAETHRPTGFGFGETMFQIFILNASRRLQADRFYTDDYREEVYTAEGLQWVDDSSFKSVILRHYPELASTGLANIKNAFEPWDAELPLEPDRHPLRAFDPELKKDPWSGPAV